jgi:hypothetical protein
MAVELALRNMGSPANAHGVLLEIRAALAKAEGTDK